MGIFFCITPTFALADQFYLIIGFECNTKKSEITAWFRGYQNEEGEQAIANLRKDSFDPRALVSFFQNPNGKYSWRTRTISRTCKLEGEKYSIEISPLLATNFHPEGFCASRIGAKVIVKTKKNRIVADGFDACRETGEVTTEIVISPHRETIYKKVTSQAFFYQNEARE
jgi:hypothetical protein